MILVLLLILIAFLYIYFPSSFKVPQKDQELSTLSKNLINNYSFVPKTFKQKFILLYHLKKC